MRDKSDEVFLIHILKSIDAIKEFSDDITLNEFLSNRMRYSAVTRELEIIGEATKNISDELKEKYPNVEWKKIAGTRDKITHHYFGPNTDLIFNIAKHDIPRLEIEIINIKNNISK